VDKVFTDLMCKIMKVYVDDMVVKSTTTADHPTYLKIVFNKVHLHNMILNLKKCFFSVRGSKFLGFMITE